MTAIEKGWTTQRLSDLVVPVRQTVQPAQLPPETRYVGLKHVESKTGLHESVALSDVNLRSGKFRFETRDILFGKLRPNLRKVAVATYSGVCSMDLIPLRPLDPAMSWLLAYQLRSRGFTADVVRFVAGQNLPRVGLKDLLSLRIPVPPLDDPRSLYELAALLDEARNAARELDERVRQLHDAAAIMLYPSLEDDDSDCSASTEEIPFDELDVGSPDNVLLGLRLKRGPRRRSSGLHHAYQSAEVSSVRHLGRHSP